MNKNINGNFWELFKRYLLEVLLFLISLVSILLTLSGSPTVVIVNRYLVPVSGIIFALASALFRIKDDIQIKRFFAETKESNRITIEAQSLIRSQIEETERREKTLREQNDFITRLIKEGLIDERSIYNIVQRNRFFYLFCYQNVPDIDRVQRVLGRGTRNPSLEAVETLGFVKVGKNHNLYVIPYDMLPTKLRDPIRLEKVIRKLVNEHWAAFLRKLQEKNRRFFARYIDEHPSPENCTYLIGTTNFHEVIINYVGYNSFSRKFKDLIQYHVDIKKLRKEIERRKHDIKRFVGSISYEILISDFPAKDRRTLTDAEGKIKTALGIKSIVDYRDKEIELKKELEKIFSKVKVSRYADVIVQKSRKYSETFSLLGIDLTQPN